MSVTTILTTVVLARIYGKENYADLVLLFSICLFVLGFQSSIISKPYAISFNDFENNLLKNYFHFNLNLKLIFTIGIIIIFPVLYYVSFEDWKSSELILFVTYIVSHSSYFFVRETLLSERKTKQNLAYGLTCSISLITLLILVLLCKWQDIRIFLGTASLIYLSLTVTYLFKNIKGTKINKQQYLDFWKVNWELGKWLIGANFLFHLSSNIYPWLLLFITKKEDVAVFGVLMSVSGLVNPVLTALSSYLLPIFVGTNQDYNAINKNVKKWTFFFSLMALGLIIVGIFLGQIIIELLFGVKYEALGVIVVYPFIAQALNIIFQPIKIALNAIKRTDVNFWILIPRSIISVTLGYLFVSKYGIVGVFYTMIIEILFYHISFSVLYRKIVNPKLIHE